MSVCCLASQWLFAQTEDYAIINAYQLSKKNYISVTVGSQPTEEKEVEQSDKKLDMAPIIAEMNTLNKMGYELFSSSTAMGDIGLRGTVTSYPLYTFVFRKKK